MLTHTIQSRAVHWLLVGLLAMLAALLLIPHVAGQSTRTIIVEVVFVPSAITITRASANQTAPAALAPLRGDLVALQGTLHHSGQAGGERIGTYYAFGIGTAAATTSQEFQASANQIYGSSRLELFEQGSLDLSGTVTAFGPSYVSVVGGTGHYFGASGQCVVEPVQAGVYRHTCDVR